MEEFLDRLKEIKSDDDLLDLTRKEILHGTPFCFKNNDADFYEFRKK